MQAINAFEIEEKDTEDSLKSEEGDFSHEVISLRSYVKSKDNLNNLGRTKHHQPSGCK